MAKVKLIPATKTMHETLEKSNPSTKRRVAGYARVSTDKDEQFSSYEAQIDYYKKFILEHDDWTFVDIYTDEGISGLSTKKRDGFNRMVKDALKGKIDLIVTKSVSRFARNTVDSLTTIRQLKEKNVEVFFEKENIWTFDGKGELLITIMSSLAQEESRSISENTTWGKRKQFADGRASIGFGSFLGYDRGPNGEFVINEEEAEIVRLIYRLFLEGENCTAIARRLNEEHIPTPAKRQTWGNAVVRSILRNEKYMGDALLQKTYSENYLTKKQVKNDGVLPQYYVENHHEGIVSKEIFKEVQLEFERRANSSGRYNYKRAFSGRIFCGRCSNPYIRVTWHSTTNPVVMWRCIGQYDLKPRTGCKVSVREEDLKAMFTEAVNILLKRGAKKGKDKLVENEKELQELYEEKESIEEKKNAIVAVFDNLISKQFKTHIKESNKELQDKYNALLDRLKEVNDEINEKEMKKYLRSAFYATLSTITGPLEWYDEELFMKLIDKVVVYERDDVRFIFKNGQEIKVGENRKIYHRNGIKTCPVCGKNFYDNKVENRKYCSRECYQKGGMKHSGRPRKMVENTPKSSKKDTKKVL